MIRLVEWLLEHTLGWFFEVVVGAMMKPIMKRFRDYGRELGRSNPQAMPEMMLNLYRTGDYQNALAMSNIGSSVGMDQDVFRADLLMQLGQLEEAVRILTQAVAHQENSKLAALANCTLGEAYLFQNRLDAALDTFNTALKLWPERAAIHRSLAEVWLRRGNREETLRCARLAVERERTGPGLTPETKATNLAVALAVLACGVAASSGDAAEVRRLTSEAAGYCGGIAVTSVAQTHVYCAIAYNTLRDSAQSAHHLELATRVDPRGAWGREAQSMASPVR